MPDVIAPTLLIGLGGIGSRIVEQVYAQVPNNLREFVAVHVFDTDVNDIEKLKSLKGHVTQTSRAELVMHSLKRSPEVKRWFPHENRLLWRKPLTEGAGAIRAVSRLAYLTAMKTGNLEKFKTDIRHIFPARGSINDRAARVIIVNSLAGGTGAGMFLQTALFVKDVLKEDFKKEAILIRGAFLLPDALIMGGIPIDPDEKKDLRTNAYACLKELNVLFRNASSHDGTTLDTPIELEYRPDQKDEQKNSSIVLNWGHLPFEFCFLYDFENTRGGNLKEWNNYVHLLSTNIFLQLFSPITPQHFSEEDNMIRSLIDGGGMNRYCSAGTAALIYPVEDIIEYCALRWAEASLKDDWLKLDEFVDTEMRDYENDMKAGIYREKPVLSKRYVALLDQFAEQGSSGMHFFRTLWESTRELNKQNKVTFINSNNFLKAVKDYTTKVIEGDQELNAAASECLSNEGKLNNKKHAKSEIRKVEAALEYYQQRVFGSLAQHKTFILNTIFFQDSHHPSCLSGEEDYRFNSWILKKPLHPVAVRYFLYQVINLIEDELIELKKTNHNKEVFIKGYSKRCYDIDDGLEDREETAEDRLEMVLNSSLFKTFFTKEFSSFIKHYKKSSSVQLEDINTFKKNKLHEVVLESLKSTFSRFARNWERYFSQLKDVRLDLLKEINKRSREHEGELDPYRIYVLARKEHKETLWESARKTAGSTEELSQDISRQIYQGQYRRLCAELVDRQWQELETETIGEVFRRDVLDWCRQQLKKNPDSVGFNVFKALQKESLESGGNEYIKNKIQDLDARTHPLASASSGRGMVYWGLNSEALKTLAPQDIEACFGSTTPGITNDSFSPYQIIRYRAVYGLNIEDFDKFSSNPHKSGTYYNAYRSSVDALIDKPERNITHHLDKRWHLPAYMPDLNPDVAQKEHSDTERAFLLGLISGKLQLHESDQSLRWRFLTDKGPLEYFNNNDKGQHGDFSHLYNQLFHEPQRVRLILESFSTADIDAFKGNCLQLPKLLDTTPHSVLDALCSMFAETKTEKIKEIIDRLLETLYCEIRAMHRRSLGEMKINTADRNAAEFLSVLAEQSQVFTRSKDERWPPSVSWQTTIERFLNNPSFQ